jgi:hypothetical protein
MGHSSTKVTIDSYGTASDRNLEAVMNPGAVDDDFDDDFDDDE